MRPVEVIHHMIKRIFPSFGTKAGNSRSWRSNCATKKKESWRKWLVSQLSYMTWNYQRCKKYKMFHYLEFLILYGDYWAHRPKHHRERFTSELLKIKGSQESDLGCCYSFFLLLGCIISINQHCQRYGEQGSWLFSLSLFYQIPVSNFGPIHPLPLSLCLSHISLVPFFIYCIPIVPHKHPFQVESLPVSAR